MREKKLSYFFHFHLTDIYVDVMLLHKKKSELMSKHHLRGFHKTWPTPLACLPSEKLFLFLPVSHIDHPLQQVNQVNSSE